MTTEEMADQLKICTRAIAEVVGILAQNKMPEQAILCSLYAWTKALESDVANHVNKNHTEFGEVQEYLTHLKKVADLVSDRITVISIFGPDKEK